MFSNMTSPGKVFVVLASAFLLVLPITVVQANEPIASMQEFSKIALPPSGELIRPISSLIVKYKAGVPVEQGGMVTGQSVVPQGVDLENPRAAGGDSTVVELEQPVLLAEAEEIADALQSDPRVEWAEPNGWVFPSAYPATPPSDTDYDDLWGLWDTYGVRVGSSVTNMTPAWTTSRGDGIVVAVLDTGQIAHPDLDGNTLPGYDFVSSNVPGSGFCRVGTPVELIRAGGMTLANSNTDGDVLNTTGYGAVGRDSNPLDPGDWGRTYYCDVNNVVQSQFGSSSWHGTHVAGTVAALTNNAAGIAGVAPNAKIVPIRVLGYGGGQRSDIADAIRWAAGLPVPDTTGDALPDLVNGFPAQVINMSLGGSGECPTSYQEAINAARTAGSIVVVAAGNENQNVANVSPANCDGVITVAATNQSGSRASYSNYGSGITIAAPGGRGNGDAGLGILSTVSTTTTGPGYPGGETGYADPVVNTVVPAPGYASLSGTSMATPHVAGVVALMLSAPGGPRTETAVRALLQNTAQPFANDLVCDPLVPSKTCGAGIANAAAFTAPQLSGMSSNTSAPSGGASVVINGSNLASVTSLRFGDSAVAITSVTPTQVTAIVPPNPAGSVAVTVRSISGQSNRLTFTYSNPAPPAPPAPAPVPEPEPAPVPEPAPSTTPLPNPDPLPVKPFQPNPVDVVQGLSPTQVQQLSGTELAQLTPQAFAVMTPAQVRALLPNQITTQIGRDRISALSPEAVRALQPRTLNAFKPWQIRALTPQQARELRPAQIAGLGPAKRAIIASKRN